jgi:hypothetical protein
MRQAQGQRLGVTLVEPLVWTCAIWLASWLLRTLFLTLRPVYVHRHFEQRILSRGTPCVLAVWHGRALYFMHLYRWQAATILVSHSKDGELVSRLLARFGLHATRGSSSRGGSQGLLQMVRSIRAGYHGAITPDGPRGPRYHAHPGVVAVAKQAGVPILPVAYGAQWKWVLQSWDRFVVPLPFSRVVVVYGEPIAVPPEASAAALRAKCQEVEASLRYLTETADGYFVRPELQWQGIGHRE